MLYYYNDLLHSFVESKNELSMRGWRLVSEVEYNNIRYGHLEGLRLEEKVEETEIEQPTKEPEVEQPEERTEDSDVLTSLMAYAAESGKELPEASKSLSMDESVVEQEEKASSNIFESIKDLREFADKDKEARVVKGKAHGVYEFNGEAWDRVGDL